MAENKKTTNSKTNQNKKTTSAKRASSATVKKNTGSKSKTEPVNNKSVSEEKNSQPVSVILLCLALLLLAFAVVPGASVWEFIRQNVFFGTFGLSFFLIPFIVGYIAFICANNRWHSKNTKWQMICFCILVIILDSFIHIVSNPADVLLKKTLWEQIKLSYEKGLSVSNGGFFGSLAGGGLALLCGKKAPAVITVSILSFGIIMLVTKTTLNTIKNIVMKPVKKAENKIEKIRDERKSARENSEENHPVDFISRESDYEPSDDVILPPPENIDTSIPDYTETDIIMPKINTGSGRTGDRKRGYGGITALDIDYTYDGEQPDNEEDDDFLPVENISDYDEDTPIEEPEVIKKKKTVSPVKPVETKPTPSTFDSTDTGYVKTKSGKTKPYKFPPLSCLSCPDKDTNVDYTKELNANGQKLVEVLRSFGVETKVSEICRGPSVTRYEIQPAPGVKISKITGLSPDIALNMAASGVRIEAPIPNKSAVGIEIPNKKRTAVLLREIIDTPVYRQSESKLNVALGKDITGNVICADLVKMPHLLIAGTTGSGKSVCINSMIASILYNATPDEVKLLMIDPKQVEFTVYNGIPHLLVPVVSDPRKAAGALSWAVTEMLERYKRFSERNVRNINGYNKFCDANPGMEKMPLIVIFIDELSDLMMAAPNEVEDSICRLAQMARAAGIHLVIATQRPSVNVITGVIKANIPSRIALSVSSFIDSKTIIDTAGAEKLLGNGDMLYSPMGISKPLRVQGAFLSDSEVEGIVEFIKGQQETEYDEDIIEEIENHALNEKKKAGIDSTDDEEDDADEMLPAAIEIAVTNQAVSTTMLQKKLKLGYARASRIVDQMEERGIVGPSEGAKPRKVLMSKQEFLEMNALSPNGVLDKRPADNQISEQDYSQYEDDGEY